MPGSPRLSLCMLASRPPATVRAVLERWRPHVDEIVLAIDERRHPELTDAVGDLADRLFVVPSTPTSVVEDYLLWLHDQCSGEWCLRSDDDEIPAQGLIEALPRLLADRSITQVFLPIRWPYGDPGTVLVAEPWREHLVPRLVRNLPGLWIAPRHLHSTNGALGARHVAEHGLLHVTLMCDSREARRARVARYEAIGAATDHESGLSINAFYLPEERCGLEVEPVGAVDRAAVAAVLAAGSHTSTPGRTQPQPTIVGWDAFARWQPARALADDGIRGAVSVVRPVTRMTASTMRHVQLTVTNLGAAWWPWDPDPDEMRLRIGQRWWRADGSEIAFTSVRSFMSEAVAPGTTTRAITALQAPVEPGRHTVTLGLVHELVRWLDDPVRLEIEVVAPGEDHAQSVVAPVADLPLGLQHDGEALADADADRGHAVAAAAAAQVVGQRAEDAHA